jgi:virulence-associated protein VapD
MRLARVVGSIDSRVVQPYVSQHSKLLATLLAGNSHRNIRFEDLRRLLRRLGFEERIKSSHHIFSMDGVAEIINLIRAYHLAERLNED